MWRNAFNNNHFVSSSTFYAWFEIKKIFPFASAILHQEIKQKMLPRIYLTYCLLVNQIWNFFMANSSPLLWKHTIFIQKTIFFGGFFQLRDSKEYLLGFSELLYRVCLPILQKSRALYKSLLIYSHWRAL